VEGWKGGRMEEWNIGMLEDWNVGKMETWKNGMLGLAEIPLRRAKTVEMK
jgi:hypothetical protein